MTLTPEQTLMLLKGVLTDTNTLLRSKVQEGQHAVQLATNGLERIVAGAQLERAIKTIDEFTKILNGMKLAEALLTQENIANMFGGQEPRAKA